MDERLLTHRSRPLRVLLRRIRLVAFGALALVLACADSAPGGGRRATDVAYADVVQKLSQFVEHELADKGIPAISVALVDDQDMVWAAGFGMQDRDAGVPATEHTVYRVGSVSKLFTDIASMQPVQRGGATGLGREARGNLDGGAGRGDRGRRRGRGCEGDQAGRTCP